MGINLNYKFTLFIIINWQLFLLESAINLHLLQESTEVTAESLESRNSLDVDAFNRLPF